MTAQFDLLITAALPIGDLVARLTLASGDEVRVVLRDGHFQGELPDRPVKLQLTADAAPAEAQELRTVTEQDIATTAVEGVAVAYEELFENGIELSSLNVRLQLVWGLHCHQGSSIAPTTMRSLNPEVDDRFVGWEHLQCAKLVGLDSDQHSLQLRDGQLGLTAETPFDLRPGELSATFGQIIALAGDYYAYFDREARSSCTEAWPTAKGLVKLAGDYTLPTLVEENKNVVDDIVAIAMRDRDKDRDKLTEASFLAKDGLFGRYPVRRYLALASQNFCHFSTLPGTPDEEDVGALKWYRYYHERAVRQSIAAGKTRDRRALMQALAVDAFGCHFLTDLFASGHMRVPRRLLGKRLGIWAGSLGLAHEMHCEDNKLGLWCTTLLAQSPRQVWLAYGDAMLFSEVSKRQHLSMAIEAVRRSCQEVVAAFDEISLPPLSQAVALVPVPLGPGEGPTDADVLPLSPMVLTNQLYEGFGPNHYPLIAYLPEPDLLVIRCGTADVNVYRDIPDKLPERFSVDFSGLVPRLSSERFPRLT